MNNKGFVLITSILIIFTMLGVLALLQLKTALHVRTTQAVARQMRSLALAETGVSRARGIIGSRDLDEILGGSPGEDPREYSILNPLDPLEARTSSLNRLRNPGDSRVYAIDAGEKELILFRISKNPAEPPYPVEDGVVLVRSFGIVQNNLLSSDIPEFKNQVTILEARFRKFNPFLLPSPLACNDPRCRIEFIGNSFEIRGGEISSVLLLGNNAEQSAAEIGTLAENELADCFKGTIPPAAVGFPSPDYPGLGCLESPEFWNHFSSNIDEFAISPGGAESRTRSKGLLLYSGTEPLRGLYSGILVTRGNVELAGDCSMIGLLIHLGGGELSLHDNCSINGALLFSAGADDSDAALRIGDRVRLSYDRAALLAAGNYLPVTHLGTRIIYE